MSETVALTTFAAADRDELRRALEDPSAGEAATQPARWRAAIAAESSEELGERAAELAALLDAGDPRPITGARGAFVGSCEARARVGFLFPGQGAPVQTAAGALGDLIPEAAAVYDLVDMPEQVPPQLVQLAVVTSSLSALRALRALGIDADVAVGHSLGELTALHWGGALPERSLLRAARARGSVMTSHTTAGTMASILSDEEAFERVVSRTGGAVTVACFNSPRQRVVSGPVDAVEQAVEHAKAEGARAARLNVVGAFHSPLMRPAVPQLERRLADEEIRTLERPVISTVTGAELDPDTDLRRLLARQLEEPVRFVEAASAAVERVDLLFEVGPGKILTGLVRELTDKPCVPLRAGEASPRPIYEAVAAAWAAGLDVTAPDPRVLAER